MRYFFCLTPNPPIKPRYTFAREDQLRNGLHNNKKSKVMNNLRLDQTQQAVILGLFTPFIDAIACKVVCLMKENTAKQEPKYYTRKETAAMLQITLPTLSRLTRDGLLLSKKIGSRILYDAATIDEAVKEERVFKYKRNRRA